jgi:hypothetical protein
VKQLNTILGGAVGGKGTTSKIVSGGVPPGMAGVWDEYEAVGYNTQRLFRDEKWKERGVDHSIIGHMWRILSKHRDDPTVLVLASGDGRMNDFKTSFYEVLHEVLKPKDYLKWNVELYSFDWPMPNSQNINSPTKAKMKKLVEESNRGKFVNLMDCYEKLVYHQIRA